MRLVVRPDWKSSTTIALGFALVGLCAALVGRAMGNSEDEMRMLFLAIALPIPFFLTAKFCSVLLHEMGHALAAWSLGLRVYEVQVCNLVIVIHPNDYETTEESEGGASIENALRVDHPWPATFISLSGPLMDVIVMAVSLTATLRTQLPWNAGLAMLGFCSANGAYLSLIPAASGDAASDIKHILDYWRPHSQEFATRSLYRIWSILEGENPARFDKEDVRRAQWIEDPLYRVSAAQIACYYAIATRSPEALTAGDYYVQTCEKAIRNAEDDEATDWVEGLRIDALLEAAFCASLFERDVRQAEEWTCRLDRIEISGWHTARRLHAALALAQGNLESCRRRIDHARLLLMKDQEGQPDPFLNTAEKFLAMVEESLYPPNPLEDHQD